MAQLRLHLLPLELLQSLLRLMLYSLLHLMHEPLGGLGAGGHTLKEAVQKRKRGLWCCHSPRLFPELG